MHPFDEHPRHLRLHDRIADRFNCISLRNTVHIRTRNYILGVRSRRFRYGSLCTWSYFDRILIVFRIDQAFLKYDRAEMAFAWRIIREYIRAFKTWRILSSYIETFDRGSKRLGVHSFGFENIFIHTKCTKFFLPYKLSVILDRSQRRNRVSLNKLCANNRSPLLESCRACTSSTLFASYRQKREKKERMRRRKKR